MVKHKQDLGLLEKEYFHLQSEVESFDSKSLTIKAWSVSLASVIAGSSAFSDNNMVIFFAAIVSLMFWVIDASWKTFQYANFRRINHIEEFMRGDREDIDFLQISNSWDKSYHKNPKKLLIHLLFRTHVFLPHGAMFILLVLLFCTSFS